MKGLLIKEPWIDLILEGKKIWEIRSSNTKKRGEVFLIKSGTGKIFGKIQLINSFPLDDDEFFNSIDKHQIKNHGNRLPYKNTHAWVFDDPIIFDKPIEYSHPQGAVIWVNLENRFSTNKKGL